MKVEITKLDNFGRGITYINGKICFVENALIGEIVKIKVIYETKKYLLGEVLDYYRLSDDRVAPVCPYIDVCGGCNLSHISLEKENEFKVDKVKNILKKFGNVSYELVKNIVCVNEYEYRNKITLHGSNGALGYYEKGSNRVISIDGCMLVSKKVNEIIKLLNKMLDSNDIKEVIIRISNELNEVMVSIYGKISDYSLLENVVNTLIINDEILFGNEMLVSGIGNKKYYISCKSFFQVNRELTKYLYDEVYNIVKEVKPKKILDLYCGAGTIGIYVSDLVDEVVGIDYSESGINDAYKNMELNNVDNIKFICEKVENVIDKFNNIDMIIVDPPRAGLDNKTIDNVKRINPTNLIYISCDPATLARDLKELTNEYSVVFVKPFNMFPRTYHVENVVWLKRKENVL